MCCRVAAALAITLVKRGRTRDKLSAGNRGGTVCSPQAASSKQLALAIDVLTDYSLDAIYSGFEKPQGTLELKSRPR